MRKLVPTLALSVAFAAAPAAAGSLIAVYRVDGKAFKQGASVGDALTFSFYADAACTHGIGEFMVSAEGVDEITPVKLARVKSGPKPPKTTELRHAFEGVAPASEVYLQVTGPGVVPIGDACQPQASTGVFAYGQIRSDGTIRSGSAQLASVTVVAPGQYCVTFFDFPGGDRIESAVAGVAGGGTTPAIVHVMNGQGIFACPANSLEILTTDVAGVATPTRFSFTVP